MRVEPLALRPADRVRRVTDPLVLAFVTQLMAHAIWKTFTLPDAGMSVVVNLVCGGFGVYRLTAIGRLAKLYRVTTDDVVSRRAWRAPAAVPAHE